MNMNSGEKTFELFPVGRIRITGGQTYARVDEAFRPALKHLELFSHAVLFTANERKYDFSGVPEELRNLFSESLKVRNGLTDNSLCVSVARVTGVYEEEGIISLDYTAANDGTVIYDIKPYFPCEDRVKTCTSDIDGPEWRPEYICEKGFTEANTVDSYKTADTAVLEINCIGEVRKRDGQYFIEFQDISSSALKEFARFSHVRVLWWFHRFDTKTYRRVTQGEPPYENAPRTGVFASRSPVRPNPVAMTTARIVSIDENKKAIKVSGLDAFDKTPVIGIKPYIPCWDRVKDFEVPMWVRHWPEWLDDREADNGLESLSLGMADADKMLKYIDGSPSTVKAARKTPKDSKAEAYTDKDSIIIRGARQNNLKNVTLTIPKNRFTVITGVSGSGKSSLAFDTIYAESQRRFMDSISTAGRQVFEQLEKPQVDQILGLPPAIAIEQKTIGRNPRSTVGTITDIYDYMRLLYSRIGVRHCPECRRAIRPMKAEDMVSCLSRLRADTEFSIAEHRGNELLESFKALTENAKESEKSEFKNKLKEAVVQGLEKGNGAILVRIVGNEELLLQSRDMCYHCSRIFFELSPSNFSFNNPEGMCPDCNGMGLKLTIDPDLIVSSPERSILDEASRWWGNLRKHREKPNANWMKGEVLALAEEMKVDLELPWKQLSEEFRHQALYGSGNREVRFTYENTNGRRGEIVRPVEGAYNILSRLFKENNGGTAERIVAAFMREAECTTCKGERLAAEGRLVSVAGTRFPETAGMTIGDLVNWVRDLPEKLEKKESDIAGEILEELEKRLQALIEVGVHYLSLNRSVPTLSGGEAQRLRLATQLGCGLTNLLYILDEPSIGLHPRDHGMLLNTIKGLRDSGNTVVVVEHDSDTMLAADRIIDIGPGAGEHGGKVIAEGSPEEIMDNPLSDTGKYLKAEKKVGIRGRQRKKPDDWISIRGARHNNLKSIDVSFPLGVFTCVTGVSGSGKSSLVSRTLYPAAARHLNRTEEAPGAFDSIEGLENIDKVISINQMPIGRTPRSNPATYTGVFDDIRDLFAGTEEAKRRKYKQNRFSFNSREGRCEACSGEGRKCIEMHFMPDVWIECSHCRGRRFNSETLEISYNGKTIADVLEMNVREALEFFGKNRKITKILQTLNDVGLDYIRLGQSALTLSGGEAQRIKLARELCSEDTGRTLYILDEPTTGLHFADIQNLLKVIHRITDAGNTVIVIEHNQDMIGNADWIIDIGPEGGSGGGRVVAQGTPEEVARVEASHTGRFLRRYLNS